MEAQKTYIFKIKWGISTDTQDVEGKIIATSDIRPSKSQIENILQNFLGEIEQIPPQYSAIKVDGERAYDLAREGEDFELKSRKVVTYELNYMNAMKMKLKFLCAQEKGFMFALWRVIWQKLWAQKGM